MISNDNIELYLSISDNNNNHTITSEENNNHLSLYSHSNKYNNKKSKKNNKKTTTIIEEPSFIVSNQSEMPDNEINNDNKEIKENKENSELKQIQEEMINIKRTPTLFSGQIITKKKSFTDKKRQETECRSRRHRKSHFVQRADKIFKSKVSNSNIEKFSDLKSEYTHISYFEFFINDNKKNLEFKLKDNTITTTKYNILTFIPKGLLYQFARLPNVYFLFIAIIQSMPIISPLNSLTAIIPLIFVLGVSMIRELIEDLGRNKYDRLSNDEEVIVLRNGKFIKSQSKTLRSGEIVLIYENRSIPADLVIIDSGMREGECYIETSSLDGEKTLKLKIANNKIHGLISKRVNNNNKRIEKIKNLIRFKISGFVQVTPANSDLNQIEGKLNFFIQENDQLIEDNFPITIKEFLLKGSILKNTNWIVGIVIYTGMNNKIILNSKSPRMKMSTIEIKMNKCLVGIFLFLVICCVICSVLYYYQYNINENFINNFAPLDNKITTECFINFFTYFLLLNTLIPISLIVTIEIIKMIQGLFIEWDAKLYCKSKKYFCKAKAVSINEELGKVNFIFSDKTGTLTMNQLQFKYCIIRHECYESVDILGLIKKTNVTSANNNLIKKLNLNRMPRISNQFNDGYFSDLIRKKRESIQEYEDNGKALIDNNHLLMKAQLEKEIFYINEFFTALAITNECMVDNSKNEVKYIGTSPDDLELVKAASRQGFKLVQTSFDKKTVIIGGKTVDFEILNILNFSSERKRMSIIFRDQEGKIKIYTKGADSEIIKRLSERSRKTECFKKINNDIDYFSNLGYRTLMIAYREIDEDDFNKWREKLHFEDFILQKKHKIIEKYYDLIEKNFEILGATIVEDKLQEKVPETIKDIKAAGIKFWVLTGDKMSTAENIGFSCNLLTKDQQIFKLNFHQNDSEHVKYDCFKEVTFFYKEFQKYLKYLANKYNYDKMNTIMSKSSDIYHFENHSNHDEISSNISRVYTINFELYESLKKKQFIEPYSIIIEAPLLVQLFRDEDQTEKFLSICYNAESVLCCRVSPFQKSQIVHKMKQFDPRAVTLAIGDGGNDVSMIMEANIGIGITGEEGMSAANASDFAIGEFKLLKRLLFCHGRINLNRISKLILYFFYKNIIFTISQLFFCPLSLSSGQTIIDDWYITCYNLVFTAVPLCISSLTDYDVKEEDGKQVSENLSLLYKESRDEKRVFSFVEFLIMMIKGIMISLLMFLVCIQNKILNNRGNVSDLWYLSLLYYLSILFVVTIHLFFDTQHIIFLLPIVIFISTILLLFVFLLLVHYGLLFDFKSKASIFPSLGNISFYLYLFFLLGFNIVFDYCHKARIFYFDNSLSCQLERMIIVDKKRKNSAKYRTTIKENIGYKKSNSINVEHSRLSLVNNNVSNVKNIISEHEKISFFNKYNISKIDDIKMVGMKKVEDNKHKNDYLNIINNNPHEKSEYDEDKSDLEEDEFDKE